MTVGFTVLNASKCQYLRICGSGLLIIQLVVRTTDDAQASLKTSTYMSLIILANYTEIQKLFSDVTSYTMCLLKRHGRNHLKQRFK